ncbi:MAG: histidine phosphatase family protein [Nitrospirota bacterium]|nr:histidine phosphatase family protein [Nitrospirota bacterium]
MTPARLFFFRHGEVANAHEKRYNGQTDVALSPRGEEQSAAMPSRLKAFLDSKAPAAVYSSDLVRSRVGAGHVAAAFGLTPIVVPELKERSFGHWEGLTWDEIQARYPSEWAAYMADVPGYTPPGGESFRGMSERILGAVRQIAARHAGEPVAMVIHGGVNRIILCDALGLDLAHIFRLDQYYACLNIVEMYENTAVVRLMNSVDEGDAHRLIR